jgi:nitroreductase
VNSLAPSYDGIPTQVARHLLSLAIRAPSVHNTQPWAWRIRPDLLELFADRSRRLDAADPTGRDLVISCGAALHHLRVAASASGLHPEVARLPDPEKPDLLATVRLTPAPRPATAAEDLRAIQERCTDRRRFTSWPVPDERLQLLTRAVEDDGGEAVALTDVTDRFRVELLAAQAHRAQRRDPAVAAEADRWTDRGPYDGLGSTHLPSRPVAPDPLPSRFEGGLLREDDHELETADGLVVLCGRDDSPAAWLRAGESLSALWLTAVQGRLSVVPLSQVTEVPETRAALQHQVLGDLAVPMLLVRVGWQAISRSQLDPTPRRPLDDVLLA